MANKYYNKILAFTLIFVFVIILFFIFTNFIFTKKENNEGLSINVHYYDNNMKEMLSVSKPLSIITDKDTGNVKTASSISFDITVKNTGQLDFEAYIASASPQEFYNSLPVGEENKKLIRAGESATWTSDLIDTSQFEDQLIDFKVVVVAKAVGYDKTLQKSASKSLLFEPECQIIFDSPKEGETYTSPITVTWHYKGDCPNDPVFWFYKAKDSCNIFNSEYIQSNYKEGSMNVNLEPGDWCLIVTKQGVEDTAKSTGLFSVEGQVSLYYSPSNPNFNKCFYGEEASFGYVGGLVLIPQQIIHPLKVELYVEPTNAPVNIRATIYDSAHNKLYEGTTTLTSTSKQWAVIELSGGLSGLSPLSQYFLVFEVPGSDINSCVYWADKPTSSNLGYEYNNGWMQSGTTYLYRLYSS